MLFAPQMAHLRREIARERPPPRVPIAALSSAACGSPTVARTRRRRGASFQLVPPPPRLPPRRGPDAPSSACTSRRCTRSVAAS